MQRSDAIDMLLWGKLVRLIPATASPVSREPNKQVRLTVLAKAGPRMEAPVGSVADATSAFALACFTPSLDSDFSFERKNRIVHPSRNAFSIGLSGGITNDHNAGVYNAALNGCSPPEMADSEQEFWRSSYWDAVAERDRAMDGVFFYAVRTTGVYCRPSCPSRRPSPKTSSSSALAPTPRRAGFRPCKRCKPDRDTQIRRQFGNRREGLPLHRYASRSAGHARRPQPRDRAEPVPSAPDLQGADRNHAARLCRFAASRIA